MSVSVQTTYQLYYERAKAGMIADLRTKVEESYAAESELNFGMAAVAGTDPEKQIKKPDAAGQTFRGITTDEWTEEQRLTNVPASTTESEGKFIEYDMVPVLRRGVIWVKVVQDVNVDDPVYFMHSSPAPEDNGYFRKDAAGGQADLVPTGVFKTSALAGELAVVEINLP